MNIYASSVPLVDVDWSLGSNTENSKPAGDNDGRGSDGGGDDDHITEL
jgi:hypothetical protein